MKLSTIREAGRFQGKRELMRHMEGKRLTRALAMKAKCFECTGGYQDGAADCGIPDCPLHPYMPFLGRGCPENQPSGNADAP